MVMAGPVPLRLLAAPLTPPLLSDSPPVLHRLPALQAPLRHLLLAENVGRAAAEEALADTVWEVHSRALVWATVALEGEED